MRLRRFELLRYGHFTDRVIDFGEIAKGVGNRPDRDLHLIIGPNEAGKSTMLNGLGDLLFGIEATSPYNFLHDYQAMRLGGVVQNASGELAFVRRKGSKATLLDDQGNALDGDALAPFTGGADRTLFERMFGLDHVRLRQGGQAILEARDDVGKTLFEASSGIANLGGEMQRLDQEADAIFRPRGSNQTLALAVKDYRAAAGAAKVAAHSTKDWKDLADDLATIAKEKDQLTAQMRDLIAETSRLERIRRAKPLLLKLDQVQDELAALGETPPLPADFEVQVRAAGEALSAAQGSEMAAREHLSRLQNSRAAITVDSAILALSESRENLVTLQDRASTARMDIHRRRGEYQELTGEAKAEMARIGLLGEPAALDPGQLPPSLDISRARTMIATYRDIRTSLAAAQAQRDDAQTALRRIDGRITQMGSLADPSGLRRILANLEPHRGIEAAWEKAAGEQTSLEDALSTRLPHLELDRDGADGLNDRVFPTLDQITAARAERAAFDRRREDHERRYGELEADLSLAQQSLARTKAGDDLPMPDDLAAARDTRDAAWRDITGHIQAGELPPADTLRTMGEQAQRADHIADRMIGDAARYEEIISQSRRIDADTDKLSVLGAQYETILGQIKDWQQRWCDLWPASGMAAPAPDRAQAVLQHRDAVLEAHAEIRRVRRDLAAMETTISNGRQQLVATLGDGGDTGWDRMSLAELLIVAGEQVSAMEARQGALNGLISQQEQCRETLTDAQNAVSLWQDREIQAQTDWSGLAAAITVLGKDLAIEEAEAVLEPIEALRGKLGEIAGLGHRINSMTDDIAAFDTLAGDLSETFGLADLAGSPAEIAGAIGAKFDAEVENRTQAELLDQQIKKADADGEAAHLALQSRANAIDALCRTASVAAAADIAAVVTCCAQAGKLRNDKAEIMDTLANHGDGIDLAGLRAACDGVDPDQIPGMLAEIEQERPGVNERLEDVIRRERDLQQRESEIRTAQGAADPEQEAAQKMALIVEQAERYLRLKTSARLLRWAVEQHRKEMQGPLLRRASTLFQLLTTGRFKRLFADFGDNDQTRLMGENAAGDSLLIDQMSDGTRDQLYLSLRLAAVANYGENAAVTVLPFVADDLLVNFDDARTAAGFKALRDLSQTVQVIVFTHHQHLADVAKGALGEDGLTIHRLN